MFCTKRLISDSTMLSRVLQVIGISVYILINGNQLGLDAGFFATTTSICPNSAPSVLIKSSSKQL